MQKKKIFPSTFTVNLFKNKDTKTIVNTLCCFTGIIVKQKKSDLRDHVLKIPTQNFSETVSCVSFWSQSLQDLTKFYRSFQRTAHLYSVTSIHPNRYQRFTYTNMGSIIKMKITILYIAYSSSMKNHWENHLPTTVWLSWEKKLLESNQYGFRHCGSTEIKSRKKSITVKYSVFFFYLSKAHLITEWLVIS